MKFPVGLPGSLSTQAFSTPEFHKTGAHLQAIHPMSRHILIPLLLAAAVSASPSAEATPSTFCNPLSLPNYPVGRMARDICNGDPLDAVPLWLLNHKEVFRELADPTALWLDGKWYLYPSVDMAWVSEDLGATWQHHPLNIRDVGYAPTVVKHGDRFLLMAWCSEIYTSSSPLGPFSPLGHIQMPEVPGMPILSDPMLFSDSGRLYFYWGCSQSGGIWGVELDANSPVKTVSQPRELIPFDPVNNPWEAVGAWNQNPNSGWMEGAWMLKQGGKYHLTYSAGGTENRGYAMGCYTSTSPLGPFTPQQRNPFFRNTHGLLTGTAHGSIVAGPENRLWVFYSILAATVHGFERRIGMDRVELDANGDLHVPVATSTPQWLPGKSATAPDWLPMNATLPTIASSNAPNLTGRFAVDESLSTWWQPAADDAAPILTTSFSAPAGIHAVRVIWRDVGLDPKKGVKPGPFRYRVEIESAPGQWTCLLDRANNTRDLLIDYHETPAQSGARARLVILGSPKGITPGVVEFTLFGKTHKP